MQNNHLKPKRALLSVSDKTGVVEFARFLHGLGVELISTGGTHAALMAAGIPVTEVQAVTQFPEMMEGRVKTLHPKILGGILGKRDLHAAEAKTHKIGWIDLVVVNLYPFAKTIQQPTCTFAQAIENIDIGGPSLIRAAAKNHAWVSVVVNPLDYALIEEELKQTQEISQNLRLFLAAQAFAHTAQYDALIAQYFAKIVKTQHLSYLSANTASPSLDATSKSSPAFASATEFGEQLDLHLQKAIDLRYGENPHQKAAAYSWRDEAKQGILSAQLCQGKPLSYNNLLDADAALTGIQEFSTPAAVIIKHANPCGVAESTSIEQAFQAALQADPMSAFGGIVALNRICSAELASSLIAHFWEVIIAPEFSAEALAIFAKKPNLRLLALPHWQQASGYLLRSIQGGVLVQTHDDGVIQPALWTVATETKPTAQQLKSCEFAWKVVKLVKSNAIVIAREQVTVGIGMGQVSRVDAVSIALQKAQNKVAGCVLASDAFFPFRDSIDRLRGLGIEAIVQPGGSLRDAEVIAACNEQNIIMLFTGQRCFRH